MERVSEQLIQKLLDIGGCGAETEWAQGYDDGVNAAIDEVERYFKQPTLNDNQQIVLEYLKSLCPPKLGVSAMVIAYYIANDKIHDNWQEYSDEIQEHIEELQELTYRQQAQVLQAFSQCALEQEEEK